MRSALLAVSRRVGRVLLSLWVVFTGVFLALAFVPNPHTATAAYQPRLFGGLYRQPAFAEQSAPLSSLYLDWLVRVATFDLGRIGVGERAVALTGVVVDAVTVTAIYLVPALLFAVVAGTLVQLLAVAVERGDLSTKATLAGAAAIAVPVFLIAYVLQVYLPGFVMSTTDGIADLGYDATVGPFARQNLEAAIWPGLTMTVYLFAIQFRAAGADLAQYPGEPFVKTARAKGVGVWGICRHVFPHSAARLLTVLTSEMLGMVLVGLYAVEWVTRTPGFGTLTIDAAGSRAPGLVFAAVLLPVFVVTVVNTVRETYYSLFDPRVEASPGD